MRNQIGDRVEGKCDSIFAPVQTERGIGGHVNRKLAQPENLRAGDTRIDARELLSAELCQIQEHRSRNSPLLHRGDEPAHDSDRNRGL